MNMSQFFVRYLFCTLIAVTTISAYAGKDFKIRSPTMEPTVFDGDTVSIDLFAYLTKPPQRWDVALYKPISEEGFWLGRIVGIPGDSVEFDRDKRLHINGKTPVLTHVFTENKTDDTPWIPSTYLEEFDGEKHAIKLHKDAPLYRQVTAPFFVGKQHCTFREDGLSCKVPPHHYFIIGDNRNNSIDSRYFGFLHESRIAAKVTSLRAVPKP